LALHTLALPSDVTVAKREELSEQTTSAIDSPVS
jgi:hypothetical protein